MNITAKTLYKTGSIAMTLIGVGHTALHVALAGKNPASAAVVKQMEDFKLSIVGLGSRSLLEFHDGFSFTMGAMLIFTGLQNFYLSGSLKSASDSHKGILLVPILLAGITFVLSLKYFIVLPQALSLIAFLAYSFSWWKLRSENNSLEAGTLISDTTDSKVNA